MRALRPGDIVLIEGNTRVSTAIKYLMQSTWSHSSLYVGPISGRSEPSGEPHVLVEADVEHGVLSAPASKYSRAHTRICRPVGLSADEIRVVTDFAVDRIGLAYDLRNTFDLLRYLLPTPPNSAARRGYRLRTSRYGFCGLGRGARTRAHSALFTVRTTRLRHFSLFQVVKPTIDACLNHHSIRWAPKKTQIQAEQSELLQG